MGQISCFFWFGGRHIYSSIIERPVHDQHFVVKTFGKHILYLSFIEFIYIMSRKYYVISMITGNHMPFVTHKDNL